MNVLLNRIQNCPDLFVETNWSVAALAKKSGVSVRMLERHFLHELGKCPKAWLKEQRQQRALELLLEGFSVKRVAAQLGYRYAHHFSREFKSYWGFCPSTKTPRKKFDNMQLPCSGMKMSHFGR